RYRGDTSVLGLALTQPALLDGSTPELQAPYDALRLEREAAHAAAGAVQRRQRAQQRVSPPGCGPLRQLTKEGEAAAVTRVHSDVQLVQAHLTWPQFAVVDEEAAATANVLYLAHDDDVDALPPGSLA